MKFQTEKLLRAALVLFAVPAAAWAASPIELRAAGFEELGQYEHVRSSYAGLLDGRVTVRVTEYVEQNDVPVPKHVSSADLPNVVELDGGTYDTATMRESTWTFDGPYFAGTIEERVLRESGNGTITVQEAFDGRNVTSLIRLKLDNGGHAMPTYRISPDVPEDAGHGPGDRRFLWFPFLRDFQKQAAGARSADVRIVASLSGEAVTAFATELPNGKVRCSYVDRMTGQLRLVETLDAATGKPVRQIRYEYDSREAALPSRVAREFGEPGAKGFRIDVAEIEAWQTEGSRGGTAAEFRISRPEGEQYDLWDSGAASVTRVAMAESLR